MKVKRELSRVEGNVSNEQGVDNADKFADAMSESGYWLTAGSSPA